MNKIILLVDDDEQLKASLVASLAKLGYIVYTSKNGSECLDLLEKMRPNLIIIDCFMPKLDGLSTLKIMQSKKIDIPIIMISSDKIQPHGFLFLQKPFKTENLVNMIENVLITKIL